MKRKKRKCWHELIAEALLKEITFDLGKDSNGYPTIHWLIAHYLLRNFSPFDRNRLLYGSDGYATAVKNNLYNAIQMLTKRGTRVYAARNGQKLTYITLDPNYKDADGEDFNRIVANVRKPIGPGAGEIKFKHPERLKEFSETTRKALPAPVSTRKRG